MKRKGTASSKHSNASPAAADFQRTTSPYSLPHFGIFSTLLGVCLFVGGVAVAQPPANLPDAPVPSALSAALPGLSQPGEAGYEPLTGRQRSSLFFEGYLGSPSTYYQAAAVAAGQGIARRPDGWPRTVSGDAKRSGSALALRVAEEGVHEAGDAALGLDPRYFHCRCSGGWRRTGHAFKMTFFAYDESGHLHPDLPRLAGDYGGSMLVTSWYPSGARPTVQGVQMGHAQVGFDVVENIAREFTPELKRIFHRKPR